MIAFLDGTVIRTQERSLILNVNGVGYLVYVPRGLIEKVSVGSPLSLFIHTNVREDDLSLFGFPTTQEWEFFKLLLTVSGVGPKSALEILNAPINQIKSAIAKRDLVQLTKIPGIGKKTAERIAVDLAGKLKEGIMSESAQTSTENALHHEKEEIIQALISLGYNRSHVVQGLKKVPSEIASEEAVIKYFLQNI